MVAVNITGRAKVIPHCRAIMRRVRSWAHILTTDSHNLLVYAWCRDGESDTLPDDGRICAGAGAGVRLVGCGVDGPHVPLFRASVLRSGYGLPCPVVRFVGAVEISPNVGGGLPDLAAIGCESGWDAGGANRRRTSRGPLISSAMMAAPPVWALLPPRIRLGPTTRDVLRRLSLVAQ